MLQVLTTWFMAVVAVASYQAWKRRPEGLPLFSGMVTAYWVFFGVQLFWGNRRSPEWRSFGRLISDQAVTETMLLVVLGIIFLWLGTRSGFGKRLAPINFPQLNTSKTNMIYLKGLAIVGLAVSRYVYVGASGSAEQVTQAIETTLFMTIILILLERTLSGVSGRGEKVLMWVLFGGRLLVGVASGWMGPAMTMGMMCGMVYVRKRHKLPVAAAAAILPFFLFFSAGKHDFRQEFWTRGLNAGVMDKISFWVDLSTHEWQNALEQSDSAGIQKLLGISIARVSLLNQAANVLEKTPGVVPFQYGRLYSYLAVGWIPRFVWPDKPTMSEANRFFQVAYGVTRESDLNRVSIASGVLTEGYINFSWFGAAGVMFLVGVLLDFWNHTFLLERRGLLAAALGTAIAPELLLIEGQMAQYIGGLLQHVFLTLLVLLPVMYLGKRRTVPGTRERFATAVSR